MAQLAFLLLRRRLRFISRRGLLAEVDLRILRQKTFQGSQRCIITLPHAAYSS